LLPIDQRVAVQAGFDQRLRQQSVRTHLRLDSDDEQLAVGRERPRDEIQRPNCRRRAVEANDHGPREQRMGGSPKGSLR
jgi:hypothetical protein